MRINFDIPPWIQDGLDSGRPIRRGGVVYDRHGGIVKHLKEAPEFDEGEVPPLVDDFEVDDSAVDDFEVDDSSLGAGLAVIGGAPARQ